MSIEIIKDRLNSYSPQSLKEEENALKEIYQEIALAGLSRQGFFKIAGFQGGTCLRIIYHLNRFSEDLDFILIQPDKTFRWETYLTGVKQEFSIYGIHLEVLLPENNNTVQKAFLKDDSFKRIFQLSDERRSSDKQKIKIKFEIDINPPKASGFETHYLDFPLPFSVVTQDKPSLFGSKCHALLCRGFLKGRDWYDFLWYVGNKVPMNFDHLKYSLIHSGHWHWDREIPLTKEKFIQMLRDRICNIDWQKAANDVAPLLKPIDQEMLTLWNQDLFLSYLDKLNDYLHGPKKKAVIFRIAGGPAPIAVEKLFSGAISEFDENDIGKIQSSGTFWCQSLESIESLKEEQTYQVLFINLDHPGNSKKMAGKTKWGELKMATYVPGKIYELPGWFIKNWNNRKRVHFRGINRALYWFQPVDMVSPDKIKSFKN